MSARLRSSGCGLYAVTLPSLAGEALLRAADAVLAGGAEVLQYRGKAGANRADAAALRELCRRHGALFIVNDDPALAAAVAADGVHLGAEDDTVAAARALLGRGAIIGVSCYDSPQRVREAIAAGADYVAIGAVYPTRTQPGARRASPALVARIAGRCPLPVVAIGGIDAENAPAVVAAGARYAAVSSALFAAPDPQQAARQLATVLAASASEPPGGPPT